MVVSLCRGGCLTARPSFLNETFSGIRPSRGFQNEWSHLELYFLNSTHTLRTKLYLTLKRGMIVLNTLTLGLFGVRGVSDVHHTPNFRGRKKLHSIFDHKMISNNIQVLIFFVNINYLHGNNCVLEFSTKKASKRVVMAVFGWISLIFFSDYGIQRVAIINITRYSTRLLLLCSCPRSKTKNRFRAVKR